MSLQFLSQLNALIAAKDMKLKEFASRISLDPSYLSKVLKGEKPLPEDRIVPMADALGLKGDKRTRFLDEAHLTISPSYIRKRLNELQRLETDEHGSGDQTSSGQ
jgi:transcriptional regulator with XRE-family HTH domain